MRNASVKAVARPICPSLFRSASSSKPFAGSSDRRRLVSARILVVDDVPANVKLLEARLSAEYFDVLTATNGAEALSICQRAECDIILLDVMMPDMDGFEVCRRLKSNPATHFIPVVMVTALDNPADRVRGLEAGADDVETNPAEALFQAADGDYDLLIVSLDLDNFDGLRLCSQARSLERTRHVPILAIADAESGTRLLRGLEIGVNDYLLRPVDKNEL